MDIDKLRYEYTIDIFKLMYESRKSVERKVLYHLNSLLLTESFILAFFGVIFINKEKIISFTFIIPLVTALLLITLSAILIIVTSISSKTSLPDINLNNLQNANISEELIDRMVDSSLLIRVELAEITQVLKIYKYLIIISMLLIFLSIILFTIELGVIDVCITDLRGWQTK